MKIKRVIDLSHTLYCNMPGWPTLPLLQYEPTAFVAREGYTMHMIRQMHTHAGTHIDAPLHFIEGGKAVDQIPIEKFVGEGVVLDLSHKKRGEEINELDLRKYDEEIRRGDVVLFYTGWDKKRSFTSEYLFEWPYLIESGAEYLVEKEVKAVGTDGLSIGGWDFQVPAHGPIAKRGSPSRTHRILLENEVIVIEEMRNLDKILDGQPTGRAYFIYAPVAFQGAEGGPCRAVALIYD